MALFNTLKRLVREGAIAENDSVDGKTYIVALIATTETDQGEDYEDQDVRLFQANFLLNLRKHIALKLNLLSINIFKR